MSRFVCHRRLMGKRLYVSSVGGETRTWGYVQQPARAKPLTAAQAELFRSDMAYLKSPASCGITGELAGTRRVKRRRKRRR